LGSVLVQIAFGMKVIQPVEVATKVRVFKPDDWERTLRGIARWVSLPFDEDKRTLHFQSADVRRVRATVGPAIEN
jgi:hypothetical protein